MSFSAQAAMMSCHLHEYYRLITTFLRTGVLFLSLGLILDANLCGAEQDSSSKTEFKPQVLFLSPQQISSSVNTSGPEAWPEGKGITTSLPASQDINHIVDGLESDSSNVNKDVKHAQIKETVQSVNSGNDAVSAEDKKREVVYVDEKGNPVDKPAEPEKMLGEAERLVGEGKFEEAIPLLEVMKGMALSPELLEKILYLYSDALSGQYSDKPLAGFNLVSSATNEAMNANLRSPRVPDALYRLGIINLDVGNLIEAEGYFKAIQRRFPEKGNVAIGFRLLGDALMEKGQVERAYESYKTVVDLYPESPALQKASVGLFRALLAVNKYSECAQILDFINRRWPRYYLDEPNFLKDEADVEIRENHVDNALEKYWLFFNLKPEDTHNDSMLAEMGDLYFNEGKKTQALEVFAELKKRFPNSDKSLLAELRLSEGGIYDGPHITLNQMAPVVTQTGEFVPHEVYRLLMERIPNEPAGQLAKLKYAMWQYLNKRYSEAMGTAADFIDAFPENPSVSEAKELIWNSFLKEKMLAMHEHNYGRLLVLWEGFPYIRERYGSVDSDLRYALAQGMLERGEKKEAFLILKEFLKNPKDPQYGEPTFVQFFNEYLQNGDWNAVLDMGELAKSWQVNSDLRKQIDYALALAAENLGLTGRALEQWKQLALRTDIPLYQRAYANIFLARDAEKRRDIKASYELNRTVLEQFTQMKEERSEHAEPERIRDAIAALMDITEVANRIPESLEWLERYSEYVPKDSPEYTPLRFREARLYRKLADESKARSILEDIVLREPNSSFGKAAASELRTLDVSRDLQNFLPQSKPDTAAK